MTPLEFLNMLWGAKPARLYILIWTRDGKQSHWFPDVTAAAKFVSTHNRDTYVGVGLSDRDYGLHHRCKSEQIAGISGLWADFDLRSDAHAKPLPATIEEALSLIPGDIPPTIIIVTGNGVHVWWLFNQPWIFANDDERKDASELSFRFQTFLRCKSNQRGWVFERLFDLPRLLRIPGAVAMSARQMSIKSQKSTSSRSRLYCTHFCSNPRMFAGQWVGSTINPRYRFRSRRSESPVGFA